jgi:hypothetical protein
MADSLLKPPLFLLRKIAANEIAIFYVQIIKIFWKVVEQLHSFLGSALDGSVCSASRRCCLRPTPWTRATRINSIGGWVYPRVSLIVLERIKISFFTADLTVGPPLSSSQPSHYTD